MFLNPHLLGEVEVTCDRAVFLKRSRAVHELSLAAASPSLRAELRLGAADAETLAGLAGLDTGFTHRDGQAARGLVRRGHG